MHGIKAMVRPRVGDFKYSQPELEVMIEDIKNFKSLGVAGVVFGILTCGGRVDIERTTLLVQEAAPLQGPQGSFCLTSVESDTIDRSMFS